MNKKEFFKKIAQEVAKDVRYRRDHRYQRVMGFLVAKGLLYTNQKIQLFPNAKIDIEDAIWVGQYVEPRILEVLPAALLRLRNHFNYDPKKHLEVKKALHALKNNLPGQFFGIEIEKLRPWLNIKLKDGRTKKMTEKKITKTFRLRPDTVKKLAEVKRRTGKSEAEIIEDWSKTSKPIFAF